MTNNLFIFRDCLFDAAHAKAVPADSALQDEQEMAEEVIIR